MAQPSSATSHSEPSPSPLQRLNEVIDSLLVRVVDILNKPVFVRSCGYQLRHQRYTRGFVEFAPVNPHFPLTGDDKARVRAEIRSFTVEDRMTVVIKKVTLHQGRQAPNGSLRVLWERTDNV
jgi:hypothetical protein